MPPSAEPPLEALAAQAALHTKARRFREAVAVHQLMSRLAPEAPAPIYNAALALWALGDFDQAVTQLRRVATSSLRPDALIQLAKIRPSALSSADRADIERGARSDPDPRRRSDFCFALGGLLEADGETDADAAFAAFAEGNRLKRALLGDTVDEAIRRRAEIVERAMATFTPAFIAHHQGGGHPTAAPIFIVGMPRSGSTLVEQILVSHRKVQGMGECPSLDQVTRGRFPYPITTPSAPGHFGELANRYLMAMREIGLKNAPRFVDKTLSNDAGVGLIALMFPRATILEVVREPVETCFANYRRTFEGGNEESYDLGDIGRAWRRSRTLMDHWDAVLPGRVIRVSYEALVADPERRIRWLVCDACGLDWSPACLRFHETKRAVLTSSAVQVRQPISTAGIGRWRRYEAHLGPLLEELCRSPSSGA